MKAIRLTFEDEMEVSLYDDDGDNKYNDRDGDGDNLWCKKMNIQQQISQVIHSNTSEVMPMFGTNAGILFFEILDFEDERGRVPFLLLSCAPQRRREMLLSTLGCEEGGSGTVLSPQQKTFQFNHSLPFLQPHSPS